MSKEFTLKKYKPGQEVKIKMERQAATTSDREPAYQPKLEKWDLSDKELEQERKDANADWASLVDGELIMGYYNE